LRAIGLISQSWKSSVPGDSSQPTGLFLCSLYLFLADAEPRHRATRQILLQADGSVGTTKKAHGSPPTVQQALFHYRRTCSEGETWRNYFATIVQSRLIDKQLRFLTTRARSRLRGLETRFLDNFPEWDSRRRASPRALRWLRRRTGVLWQLEAIDPLVLSVRVSYTATVAGRPILRIFISSTAIDIRDYSGRLGRLKQSGTFWTLCEAVVTIPLISALLN
jgi:hypothetical protein